MIDLIIVIISLLFTVLALFSDLSIIEVLLIALGTVLIVLRLSSSVAFTVAFMSASGIAVNEIINTGTYADLFGIYCIYFVVIGLMSTVINSQKTYTSNSYEHFSKKIDRATQTAPLQTAANTSSQQQPKATPARQDIHQHPQTKPHAKRKLIQG